MDFTKPASSINKKVPRDQITPINTKSPFPVAL
jgi:hypothetical protein